MTEYLAPAIAVAAMGWALRLEAKSSSMNRAIEDHREADLSVHVGITKDLTDIKGGQNRLEGKVDQILLKFIPQQVQGFQDGPR
jgi:hypothetical protein